MNRTTRSNRIECILFDLGGVLVHVDPGQTFARWAQSTAAARKLATAAWQLPEAKLLETGRITPASFADRIIATYGLQVSRDDFLQDFQSWIRYEYPGSIQLLDELKNTIQLACLSNTNQPHWRRMVDNMAVVHCFEQTFLSFETGLFKPDPRAYLHAARALGRDPGAILFLDDMAENVQGARAVGLQARQAKGPAAARAILAQLGLCRANEFDGSPKPDKLTGKGR